MSLQPTMSPLDVKARVESLQRSWMARHTRAPHEVSGLYQWVVFYRPQGTDETRMASGQHVGVNPAENSLSVAKGAWQPQRIRLDEVLEVHLKPCA